MFIKMVLYVPYIPYCGPETGAVWDKKNRRNHTQKSIISPIQNIVGQLNRQPFSSVYKGK